MKSISLWSGESGCLRAEDGVEMQVVAVAHVLGEIELGVFFLDHVRAVIDRAAHVTAPFWLKRASCHSPLAST